MKKNIYGKHIIFGAILLISGSLHAMDAVKKQAGALAGGLAENFVAVVQSQTAADLFNAAGKVFRAAGEGTERLIKYGIDTCDARIKKIEQEAQREKDGLIAQSNECYRIANDPDTTAEVRASQIRQAEAIQAQMQAITKKALEETSVLKDLANQAMALPTAGVKWGKDMVERDMQLRHELAVAGVQAVQQRKLAEFKARLYADKLTDPKTLAKIVLTAAGLFAVWQGVEDSRKRN